MGGSVREKGERSYLNIVLGVFQRRLSGGVSSVVNESSRQDRV